MHLGIDLGSRTIKLAAIKHGKPIDFSIEESGFDPHAQSMALIARFSPQKIVATGYGRHLAMKHFAHEVITEIKAHALGARHFYTECQTILDVGGQDSKVISLTREGKIAAFQMNDKCAAGTGRFLEMMATVLGFTLTEFGTAAAQSDKNVPINSMCAVFAESEVVSLKNRGVPMQDIARAIHLSVVERLAAMLVRIGHGDHVVFSGGVANNAFLAGALSAKLGVPVLVPEHPSIIGALGAALHAARCEK